MRIDSHQHFWKISRGDYYWMRPTMKILHRDYQPDDLRPHLQQHRIDKTVVIQAAPTVAETDFLLGLAQEHDFIAGVVGWLDMDSADFPALFEKYVAKAKFIGLRPMLEDLPEDDWILRQRVGHALSLVAERDFPFDLLVRPRNLPAVLKVLNKQPKLRAVIDHISKPEIREQKLEPWKSLLREAAAHKNVWCKLSGMITEADREAWTLEHLTPYVEHVLECFGPERIMFGSDWPVCLLAGSYHQVIESFETILKPHLDNDSAHGVFGGAAARFYKLR